MIGSEFKKLFESKFGTERGSQFKGAGVLELAQGNLSKYLNGGSLKVPQKYVDKLASLPDYKIKTGEYYEAAEGTGHIKEYFRFKLTPNAKRYLYESARFNTPAHVAPDFGADEDATAKFMENLIGVYLDGMEESFPDVYKKVLIKIKTENEEAKKQFALELNGLRNSVADELTENELKNETDDEVDPLA
jgi:hypothetical protein